jgi:hypothetical protein
VFVILDKVSLETAWNLWLHRLAWSQATGLFLHSWQSPILTCFQTDGPFDYISGGEGNPQVRQCWHYVLKIQLKNLLFGFLF